MLWSNEIGKVETEYTGGGVWLAFVYVDAHTYYSADNTDAIVYVYDDTDEDEEEGICTNVTRYIGDEYDAPTDAERGVILRLWEALDRIAAAEWKKYGGELWTRAEDGRTYTALLLQTRSGAWAAESYRGDECGEFEQKADAEKHLTRLGYRKEA